MEHNWIHQPKSQLDAKENLDRSWPHKFPGCKHGFFDAWSILGPIKWVRKQEPVSSSLHNLINKLGSERKDCQEVPWKSSTAGLVDCSTVFQCQVKSLQSNVRYSNAPPRLSQSIQPQQEKLYWLMLCHIMSCLEATSDISDHFYTWVNLIIFH